MILNNDEFIDALAKKAATVLQTIKEKGTGYNPTEGTQDYDPFYNYTLGAEIAGISPEQSMIARIGEKLVRLQNILKDPTKAGNEPIRETAKDIVGISLMLWQSAEEAYGGEELTLVESPQNDVGSVFSRLLGIK